MLFEEFVPLEYRQQLIETQTSRRRLPSFFSPSNKSKQWKPAATLNGRPYVIGHVPQSPSHKEVEFEGLLRGSARATKVISVRPSQPPSSLSPLNTASERVATPRPIAMTQEPPLIPANSGDSDPTMTTQKRPSRFRLPGGIPVPSPGGGRKSGMLPAEYSAVDFDTRMAGYSDDEERPGNRESRDDAWVDILVTTHSRRMGSQEAEMRMSGDRIRGLKGGRSEPLLADPEIASMEVAQALAGVRTASPPSDDENDGRYTEPVSRYRDSEYDETHEEPVIEPEGYEPEHSQDPEDDPDIVSIMSHPRKRMGYFDLHPERRPVRKFEQDEDPRARLTQSHSDEEEEEAAERALNYSRTAALTARRNDDLDVPEFSHKDGQLHQKEGTYSRTESATIPQPVIDPPKRATSKTAALIEMYREKEREREKPPVSPAGSSVPSKLPIPAKPPIRSSSLPQRDVPPSVEAPITPLPTVPVEPSSPESPSPEHEIERDSGLEDPPRVPLDETGRSSPGRYVHGAPLHNVLEEEEEE